MFEGLTDHEIGQRLSEMYQEYLMRGEQNDGCILE